MMDRFFCFVFYATRLTRLACIYNAKVIFLFHFPLLSFVLLSLYYSHNIFLAWTVLGNI